MRSSLQLGCQRSLIRIRIRKPMRSSLQLGCQRSLYPLAVGLPATVPDRIRIMLSLPRTSVGKLDKKLIRKDLAKWFDD